jgi:BirA family biotin operon repressor/biotin-[acetyl-CoA-carboxylase] ligase
VTFPLASARSPRLVHVAETGSTNADLLADASAPHGAVLATLSQTAGRGRLDRRWVARPGRTVAVSVLLERGSVPVDALGWVPLLAGVAMRAAVASLVGADRVGLKWPNDVQVGGAKVCGVLAELPTDASTSLRLEGAEGDAESLADLVVAGWVSEVLAGFDALAAAGGDAVSSGLHARVAAECSTLGREVRVELPSGELLTGLAVAVDEGGRLVVRPPSGAERAVASGDVTHVRHG